MAAIDLDAIISADSSVTASVVMATTLGSSSVAGSVFTPPMLSQTKGVSCSAVADSVMAPAMLARAAALASPVVADSLGSGFIGVARLFGASAVGGSVFPPAFMLSTDGMATYVIANSVVAADMLKIRPLASVAVAGSLFAPSTMDIFRLPRPNVPQPLNRPPTIRVVTNPPGDPQMGIGRPPVRQRGR